MADPADISNDFSDVWSQWLLNRRHGGDSEYNQRVQEVVAGYRNRVLDNAALRPGYTLVDVGTGEGLVAFGAIDRIGESLHVIVTDISLPMLQYTESMAVERGVHSQMTFVQGSADRLSGIADASVDVLTTRAVLAYVRDKPAAFHEFRRVLKPGGRLSMLEPIMQDDAFEGVSLARMIKTPLKHPNLYLLQWRHRLLAAQFGDSLDHVLADPVTGFNERDLFLHAREAGFDNLRVTLEIELQPSLKISWDAYLDVSVHPRAPTLREILARYPEPEVQEFERVFRPIIEGGTGQQKSCAAFVTGNRALS